MKAEVAIFGRVWKLKVKPFHIVRFPLLEHDLLSLIQ